jgi:RNase P subunit RPR2
VTDYNSDQGRELRRARLVAIRPFNAPDVVGKSQFEEMYKQHHVVVREIMTDAEESGRVMFCPACQEQVDDTLVAARKLHVMYEEDPLRNYRALVTVCCKGCGWNEIIPLEQPPALPEEDMQVLREAGSFRARDQMDAMRGYQNAAGGLLNPSAIGQQAMRQLGKSAMLSQMYGAGPTVMKSLLDAATAKAPKSMPRRGQALADSIWQDYDELNRMRAEATDARSFVTSRKLHDQMMRDMAAQMAKKIDEDVMSQLTLPNDKVKVVPRPKYATAPPPAPSILDKNDKAEMARMIDEAYKRSEGDPSKLRSMLSQVREFFR